MDKIFIHFLFFNFLILLSSCSSIKSGKYVRFKNGDTLNHFAKEHKVSAELLARYNSQDKFYEGEWVFIPHGTGILTHFFGDSFFHETYQGSDGNIQHKKFLWPVPASHRISSSHGVRNGRPHDGIDIPAKRGSNILAAAQGRVMYAGRGIRGYGNLTVIKHDDGFVSVYAHADKNLTKKGEKVQRGEVIAKVGSTGRSSGPHLHFEIRKRGESLNPLAYLPHRYQKALRKKKWVY